jgi:hypothetical protein
VHPKFFVISCEICSILVSRLVDGQCFTCTQLDEYVGSDSEMFDSLERF